MPHVKPRKEVTFYKTVWFGYLFVWY